MKNIHLILTDQPSRLYEFGREYHFQSEPKESFRNYDIYITSNLEDINENDYVIIKDSRLVQVSYLLSDEVAKGFKVILTTNNLLIKDGVQSIDNEFLKWFCKNSSCEWVEVKLRYRHYYKTGEIMASLSNIPEFSSRNMQCIKVEKFYSIIIPKEEPKPIYQQIINIVGGEDRFREIAKIKPKQETLEEIAERIYQENFNNPYREEIGSLEIKDVMVKLAKSNAAKEYWFKQFSKLK